MATITDPVTTLNRMVKMLLGSFPVYLETTRPWSIRDPKDVCGRLTLVASDQRAMADRLIKKIRLFGVEVDPVGFPCEFTGFNDLEVTKTLDIAIKRQRSIVQRLAEEAALLAEYEGLVSVVQETVGNARGHLASMEELRTAL